MACSVLPLRAQAPANVDAAVDALEMEREVGFSIERQPLEDLGKQYGEALEKRKTAAQAASDLDGATAASDELKKLASGDVGKDLPKDAQVARLKKTYLEQIAKVQVQVSTKLVAVEKTYATGLDNLTAELTKAGRLDEAKQVRERKEAFIREFKERKSQIAVSGTRRAGETKKFEIASGVMVEFCWVPPGSFRMGTLPGEMGHKDEEPQHQVTLSRGFWMAKTELTQAQWSAVAGNQPSHHKGDARPVEQVSWLDICGDDSRSGGFLGKVNQAAQPGWKFDLPTEAEWEYACRAGTIESLGSGKEITTLDGVCSNLGEVGWYSKNSGGGTKPVAQKKPNRWGLHDMHGNVWEWCADWSAPLSGAAVTDPKGPELGAERCFRGGSWRHDVNAARSGARSQFRPNFRYLTLGFRLVLRPPVGQS